MPKTPPIPITPRLLNIRQTAEYLGTSVWLIRQLEWAGELRSIRNMGKKLLFDINDLNKLVESRKSGGVQ
jgi:hypothetical protein